MTEQITDTTVFPNTAPTLTDHFIGTDVSDTSNSPNGEVVTFTFQATMDLFESNIDLNVSQLAWDAAADITDATAFTSGDKIMVYEEGVGLRKVDYDDLPVGGGGGSYTQEEIEDIAGGLFTSNTETLITTTYNDAANKVDLTVDDDLSNYDNSTSLFVTAATAPVVSVAGKTGAVTLAASDIASGTLDNARISEANVTQHEAALDIAATQITGTVSSGQIADEAVSLAKVQHIATDSLLGRDTAGTGDVEVLSATTARSVLNVEDGSQANTIDSDPTGITGADQVTNVVSLTQAEYDAITPDASTFYIISG